MRKSGYIEKNEKQCFEVVSLIVEYLIYGDKNDSQIFEYFNFFIFSVFCEYNFMGEYIYLSSQNNFKMHLEIIKSFSILILNLSNKQSIYFIFSNNFINQIISNDYQKHDEDFVFYYINFLKSLAMKIDLTTIQFFFQRQFNNFPLLKSALKYYNYPDPMIKNTVRTIVLTFLKCKIIFIIKIKVDYEPMYIFFTSLPIISYFPCLICKLRDLITKLNKELLEDGQDKLKMLYEEIFDDVLYLQDIFSLNLKKINAITTNTMFYYLILPVVIQSLVSTHVKLFLTLNIIIAKSNAKCEFVHSNSLIQTH